MPSIKQTIDGHNKSTLPTTSTKNNLDMCSCPKTIKNCAHCLTTVSPNPAVVYQATVTIYIKDKTTNRPPQTYVCLTENTFKTRLANHKASFNSFDKRNATELSKYVWELKNRNSHYTIKWKLLKRAKSYNCASNRCNLCLWEIYFIIKFNKPKNYGGPYVQFTKQVLNAKAMSIVHNQNDNLVSMQNKIVSIQNKFDLNSK
jgi:hypothetical protein